MSTQTAKKNKTRTLCEAAIFIALAQILGYLTLYRFPQGGTIDMAMLPIVLFAVRWGAGWGALTGFVYGLLQYFLGNGIAIDWTTMIADYLVAFTLLGLGAGLFRGRKYGIFYGAGVGCLLRFITHWIIGAVVWGKYMPDEFFGMTMTNEWFYSFLYNSPYMIADFIIIVVISALLYKPLNRYFTGADIIG